MADLADRFRFEQRLQDTLNSGFRRLIQDISRSNEGVIPVDRFQQDMARRIRELLATVYVEAGRTLQSEAQDATDEDGNPIFLAALDILGDARTWAGLAAGALIGHLLSNSVEKVQQARQLAADDFLTVPEDQRTNITRDAADEIRRRLLATRLENVFDEARAQKIAATEVTRANTAGETGTAERIRRQTDVVPVAFFNTEADDRVCPICAPLHLLHERFWRDRYPAGPPLHVACRCFVTWKFFPVGDPEADGLFSQLNPLNTRELELPAFA